MKTVLTIVNKGVDLSSQKVLVYLRPQESSSDWESIAWQHCSPEPGGSKRLDSIVNEIAAYASYDNDTGKTKTQIIPCSQLAEIIDNGNELSLKEPIVDNRLTPQQSGIKNSSKIADIHAVWCINGKPVCRTINPMFNTGISSFELKQKVYITIGSSKRAENFFVQNWTEFAEFEIDSNLLEADIEISIDTSTNKPVFTLVPKQYK